MERRLTAVLAADVVGYSRLMGQDDLGTLTALRGHRQDLFEPKLAEHGGRIVKTTGDGFLIEFAGALAAARYAVACGLAAWLYTLKVPQGWMEAPASETEEGLRLARTAIAHGGDDPEALCTAGYALAFLGGAPEVGLVPIDQALALNPNGAQAWSFSGWVRCYSGDAPTAVEHFQRATRLSPLDPMSFRTHAGLAFAHLFTERFDEAARWARCALVENPSFSVSHRVLAASLGHLGRADEARAAVRELLRLVPHLTVARYGRETRFRHPAYLNLLLDGLRAAGLPD